MNSYCAMGRRAEMQGRPQARNPPLHPRVTPCDAMLPFAPAFASSARLSEQPHGPGHQSVATLIRLSATKKMGGLHARLYTLINYTFSQIPPHLPIIPQLLTPFHFLPASTPPANQPIHPPTHPRLAASRSLPSASSI